MKGNESVVLVPMSIRPLGTESYRWFNSVDIEKDNRLERK